VAEGKEKVVPTDQSLERWQNYSLVCANKQTSQCLTGLEEKQQTHAFERSVSKLFFFKVEFSLLDKGNTAESRTFPFFFPASP